MHVPGILLLALSLVFTLKAPYAYEPTGHKIQTDPAPKAGEETH